MALNLDTKGRKKREISDKENSFMAMLNSADLEELKKISFMESYVDQITFRRRRKRVFKRLE